MQTITLRDGRYDDEISEGVRVYRQVDEVLNTFEGGTIGPVKVSETTGIKDKNVPEAVRQVSKHAKVTLDGGAETSIHQFSYFDADDNQVVTTSDALGGRQWVRACLPEREGSFEGNLLEFDAVYVTLTVRVPFEGGFGLATREAECEMAKTTMVNAIERASGTVVRSHAKASLEHRVHVLATDGEVLAMDVPAAESHLYAGNCYHVIPASVPLHKAIAAIVRSSAA